MSYLTPTITTIIICNAISNSLFLFAFLLVSARLRRRTLSGAEKQCRPGLVSRKLKDTPYNINPLQREIPYKGKALLRGSPLSPGRRSGRLTATGDLSGSNTRMPGFVFHKSPRSPPGAWKPSSAR